MKLPDGAQLRLSLEWMPPVTCADPMSDWLHQMGNRVDDAQLYHLFHFNQSEVRDGRIFFYMKTDLRIPTLRRMLKNDAAWKAFVKDNPDVKLEFAEDIEGP